MDWTWRKTRQAHHRIWWRSPFDTNRKFKKQPELASIDWPTWGPIGRVTVLESFTGKTMEWRQNKINRQPPLELSKMKFKFHKQNWIKIPSKTISCNRQLLVSTYQASLQSTMVSTEPLIKLSPISHLLIFSSVFVCRTLGHTHSQKNQLPLRR